MQAGAQPQVRVFSPILHYFSTFVQHDSAFIYAHLLFIVVAGVLWPLQVSTPTVKGMQVTHRAGLSATMLVQHRNTDTGHAALSLPPEERALIVCTCSVTSRGRYREVFG